MSYTKTTWVNNTTPINETNLNKIESGIKNNDINIGEENYDNTKTYEVGDIVRYNEKIYKCITAITTAENFDISKWEQTNIVEIVQSEKSKIYELIEALSTPIVGEGENITLNDTAEKRFENFDIEGNSEQETRSGKNYLNTLAKYKAGDTVTIEGITYTFNDDGSITLNGTASATANSNLDFSVDAQKINGTNKKIVGLLTGSQVPSKIALVSYTSNFDTTAYLTFSEVNKSLQSKMKENKDYTLFRITVYSGTTVNNQTVYYQILDTSETDLTYEQYGVSPSPDYPSSIVAVGSNVNIFDKESVEKDYRLGSTGELFPDKGYFTSDYIELSINTNYTLSINETGVSTAYVIYDKDKKFISRFLTSNNKTYLITNNTSSKQYIRIASYLTDIDNVKFEEGIVATPWSPYGQGCVKVTKCNKNILKNSNSTTTAYGITANIQSDDSVEVSGTSTTANAVYLTNVKKIDANLIKKGNYTISFKNTTIMKNVSIRLRKSDGTNKTEIKNIYLDKINKTEILDLKSLLDNDTIQIELDIICYSTNTYNFILYMQLEQGSTESSFEQHEEQSYIMPVQKEMLENDYFDYDNEEEVHTWGKLVLNGTEKIGISGASTDEILAVVYDINNAIDGSGYSNCFLYSSQVALNKLNVYNNGKNLRVCVDKSKFVDLESFKSKIIELYNEGTPVVVYYKLVTPTRLAFTDEQKAVAKKLNNARTYKGVTHIYSNDAVSPNCYVEAAKDLTTLIQ